MQPLLFFYRKSTKRLVFFNAILCLCLISSFTPEEIVFPFDIRKIKLKNPYREPYTISHIPFVIDNVSVSKNNEKLVLTYDTLWHNF